MTLPPPPPLVSVVEVAPLVIAVASLVIPEAQSPTLIIYGVLGKLTPKEEAIKYKALPRRKVQVPHLGLRILIMRV